VSTQVLHHAPCHQRHRSGRDPGPIPTPGPPYPRRAAPANTPEDTEHSGNPLDTREPRASPGASQQWTGYFAPVRT
jgi:hypothetical protein